MSRERLIASGLIKPAATPPIAPAHRSKTRGGSGSSTTAGRETRIFLDESGKFEGTATSLVAGLSIAAGGPSNKTLRDLLKQAVAAYEACAGPLPEEGLHGYHLRRASHQGYRELLTIVLDGLERTGKHCQVLATWDRSRTFYRDRNVAHAAVAARGLVEHLTAVPQPNKVRITVAGRSTDKGQITDTSRTLELVVHSRLAEELAVSGAETTPEATVRVRHINCKAWRDPAMAGLLIADLLSNLIYSGKQQFRELHQQACALFPPCCPHTLTPRKERSRVQQLRKELGPAFLAWYHGPAGPIAPSAEDRAAERAALKELRDPGHARLALEAVAQAIDRQLRHVRNLVVSRRLGQLLLELCRKTRLVLSSEIRGVQLYNAFNCLMDVANHDGDVRGAERVMGFEAQERRHLGLGCVVQSLEFRNRAAETWINAYDFEQAAAELDRLIDEIRRAGQVLGLGSSFPTYGRVLSHRAQVHHYLGQDDLALPLYKEAGRHYSEPLDHTILKHHRTRSLLGLGRLKQARDLLQQLGVRDDLSSFAWGTPFLADLTLLFLRTTTERGRGQPFEPLLEAVLDAEQMLEEATSLYPGVVTLKNLARVALERDHRSRCLAAQRKLAALLEGGDGGTTLASVALVAALEGVQNSVTLGETALARTLLDRAHDSARAVMGKRAPATMRAHFESAATTVLGWFEPDDVAESPDRVALVAACVPFGCAGSGGGRS